MNFSALDKSGEFRKIKGITGEHGCPVNVSTTRAYLFDMWAFVEKSIYWSKRLSFDKTSEHVIDQQFRLLTVVSEWCRLTTQSTSNTQSNCVESSGLWEVASKICRLKGSWLSRGIKSGEVPMVTVSPLCIRHLTKPEKYRKSPHPPLEMKQKQTLDFFFGGVISFLRNVFRFKQSGFSIDQTLSVDLTNNIQKRHFCWDLERTVNLL